MLKASTYFLVLKGDNYTIRDTVFGRDNGVCNECGEVDRNWQADHILPVHKGGGGCTIDNFQTLCVGCHKRKTVRQIQL
jgi:5-methylcytosine-specific restriction endonuclease McrA